MKIMQRLLLVALFVPAGSVKAALSEWISTAAALGFFMSGVYALHHQKTIYVYAYSQFPAECIPYQLPMQQLIEFSAFLNGAEPSTAVDDFVSTVKGDPALNHFFESLKKHYPDDGVARMNALFLPTILFCMKGGTL